MALQDRFWPCEIDFWTCEIDFWPCEIILGLARSIFCLARSILALQDRLWPCKKAHGLARRPMDLRDRFLVMQDCSWPCEINFLPCEIIFCLARSFMALQEGPSTTYYCTREALLILRHCRTVSWFRRIFDSCKRVKFILNEPYQNFYLLPEPTPSPLNNSAYFHVT